MPPIDAIPLNLVEVHRKISDAPVGAVLQIAPGDFSQDTHVVVMRCQQKTANGQSDGFVFLEGAPAGIFVTDEQQSNKPAIDLTNITEIVLQELSLSEPIKGGDVCHASGGILCLAVTHPSAPASIVGYARLEAPRKGHIEDATEHIRVGRPSVRQRKSDDPSD
jgi:hypothetical protein